MLKTYAQSMIHALAPRVRPRPREPFCIITSRWRRQLHTVRIGCRVAASFAHLRQPPAITQHNLVFQARLMGGARDAIIEGTYPEYLKTFFANYFGDAGYPEWCVNALRSVGVDLLEGRSDVKVISGDGAKWEYSDAA